MQKSLMHIEPSFVADDQSPELAEPGESALHNPPVPTESFAALDTTSSYARCDAPLAQSSPASGVVVPFICMQLGRSLSSSSANSLRFLDRLDSINHISESVAVMNVGRSTDYCERNAFGFDHKMALRRRFSFICWIGAGTSGTFAPFLAAIVAESTEALDQSILPASPSLSNSTWWRRSHTPASCQSFKRRQQVLPLPQPISGGRYDQGSPVLSTKMMPVSAARLATLGRPPFGLAGSGGNSGSITSQNSSLSIGFAIPRFYRIS